MKNIFSFFIRLLVSFLLTKVVLGAVGASTPAWLLALSLALTLLSYLPGWWCRSRTLEEMDWCVARLLIKLNQLPDKRLPTAAPPEKSSDSSQK